MKSIKTMLLILLSFFSANCFSQVYKPVNEEWEKVSAKITEVYKKHYIPECYFTGDKIDEQKKLKKEISKTSNENCSNHDHSNADNYIFVVHLNDEKKVTEVNLETGDSDRAGKFTEEICKSLKKSLKKIDPYPLDEKVEVLELMIGFKPNSLDFQVSPLN